MKAEVLCVGEVLWDALPDGLFPGGAVFNVAAHLHVLGTPVAFASCVGDDELGREMRRRVRARGLDDDLLQTDTELPTGFVEVALAGNGIPTYTIREPAAWDRIRLTDSLRDAAQGAAAIVYGSLSQRGSTTRRTLDTLREITTGVKVFDVNMRPPFVDRDIIERSLVGTDLLKLNDEELAHISAWFGWPPATALEQIADRFGIDVLCVTRGADGATLWRDGVVTVVGGTAVDIQDTVGAGDAFLAALVSGYLEGGPDAAVLDRANRLGGFVASQSGAIPSYDAAEFSI